MPWNSIFGFLQKVGRFGETTTIKRIYMYIYIYFWPYMGVSLNGGTHKHPKMIILVGKPMVVGYHHFRKPPYVSGQITTIPKPELRWFWGIPFIIYHLGPVEVAIMCPDLLHLFCIERELFVGQMFLQTIIYMLHTMITKKHQVLSII